MTPGIRRLMPGVTHEIRAYYVVVAGHTSNDYWKRAYLSVLNFGLVSHVLHAYNPRRLYFGNNPTMTYVNSSHRLIRNNSFSYKPALVTNQLPRNCHSILNWVGGGKALAGTPVLFSNHAHRAHGA